MSNRRWSILQRLYLTAASNRICYIILYYITLLLKSTYGIVSSFGHKARTPLLVNWCTVSTMKYHILKTMSCINLGVLAVRHDAFYFSPLKEQMLNIVTNLKSHSCFKLPKFHSVISHGSFTTGIFVEEKNTYFIDLNIFIVSLFICDTRER